MSHSLKSHWVEKVSLKGSELREAPFNFQDDEDVVTEAIKNDCYSIEYASDRLKDDKKFFLSIIQLTETSGRVLKYASDDVKKDADVVKKAVQSVWGSFQYSGEDLRDDKDFVLEIVQLKEIHVASPPAFALQYASKRLQNDKEVVLSCVKQTGTSLRFASLELKNDSEVVMEAVKQNPVSLREASIELRSNKEFCMECVKINKLALNYINEDLKKDEVFLKIDE